MIMERIFWQEDKAIYELFISYREDQADEAEEVIVKWMNSFD